MTLFLLIICLVMYLEGLFVGAGAAALVGQSKIRVAVFGLLWPFLFPVLAVLFLKKVLPLLRKAIPFVKMSFQLNQAKEGLGD